MAFDFRRRLASGETLLGTMVTLATPASAEILADAGYDFFFIDGEHAPLGTSEVLSILQAVDHRVACLVRVPDASEVTIKRTLDLGVHGIIVPQVNDAVEAERIVRWSKYPPQGSRGVGLARAQGYGANLADYLDHANDRVAVIVQAEHRTAVQNIESIVQVAGIDAIQLGPYDLSASLGKMGQITDPEVTAALDRICAVARQAGLPVGSFGVTAESVGADRDRGATLLCIGTDTLFLSQAARAALSQLKQQI
jgi:2-keto-3-deoxy-L-rhamnonate aldolase RhmA